MFLKNTHQGMVFYSLLLTAAMGNSILDAVLRAGLTAAISLIAGFVVNFFKARRPPVPD